MRALILFAILLLPLTASAEAYTVQELLVTSQTSAGQPITLPEHPQLRVSRYTIAPGGKLPQHKHPSQRYAYILSGEIDVVLPDLHKTAHSKAGDFIVEATDTWHYGQNNGTEPVVLLVIDQMPQDAKTNVILKDPAISH